MMEHDQQQRTQAELDASVIDIQNLASSDVRDIRDLRSQAQTYLEGENSRLDPALRAWAVALLEDLPQQEQSSPASVATTSYTTYQLTASDGARTYNVELRVDDAFEPIRHEVRDYVQTMLDRAVQDQIARFVERARQVGMNEQWRRAKGSPFPHVLPYLSSAPNTTEGKLAEEAVVVAAAFHLALSQQAIRLDINQYSQGPSFRGMWSCGFADVNSYNSDRVLVINLNERAIREAGFSSDFWASTVAHEILHTLGWGHPRRGYSDDLPIEIWQWCIQSAGGGAFVEGPSWEIAMR